MILILDNGMFANVLNQYLLSLKYKTIVMNSQDFNPRMIENLKIKAIILSNGHKENINNTARNMQNYIWKVPILGVGVGAIVLGLLFNAKISETKVEPFVPFSVIHDNRTIFNNLKGSLKSTKWCRYTISDQLFKKTDLEVSSSFEKEILSFRHKNLAIEGVLFDITSSQCTCGKEILNNFLNYYVK